MATVKKRTKKAEPKQVVVQGIDHGLSGYTNYGCRCDDCREANSEHSREYRARRFAGDPLCIIKDCDYIQSRSYGNGLCWSHSQAQLAFRARLEELPRLGLKRIIRKYNLDIRVLKRYTDDDLRELIAGALGPQRMARLAA